MQSFWNRKKILITGGAGYLANNLVQLLSEETCTIFLFDRTDTIFPDFGSTKAQIIKIQGDLLDFESFKPILENIDILYHFAAQTSSYVADENPLKDLLINVIPLLNIIETFRTKSVKPSIIFAGTVTVYGNQELLPVDEERPENPTTIYDIHKLFAEQYLQLFSRRKVISGTTLRLSNIYGPGPKSSSSDRGIINQMIKKALGGNAITIYGDGEFVRDYLYVKDAACAFKLAAEHMDELNGKSYIISSGEGYSIKDAFSLVAKLCQDHTNKTVEIRHIQMPENISPIELRNFVGNSTKFSSLTNWNPGIDLPYGINLTINSYLNG